MTSRITSGWSRTVAWTLRAVTLCLLPALASETAAARRQGAPRQACPQARGVVAYLLAVGPPPLRFSQSLPPPDLSTRPAPAAPPLPAAAAEIASVNAASATPFTGGPMPGASVPAAPAAVATSPGSPAAPQPEKPADPLIPDVMRHEVRLEEILPYFQFPGPGSPGSAGTENPQATRLPVSSAVYRQQ